MIFWFLVGAVVTVAVVRTVVLVMTDGLGARPGPRSHAVEGIGSPWPQHDRWDG